jgi:hypothetical protein
MDMMKKLAEEYLKGRIVTPIHAPKKPNEARPNKHDAVACWKAAISTAPQDPYQHNVLCGVQASNENGVAYEMETVTPPYDGIICLSELFDAVARMVYAGKAFALLLV